MTETRRVLVTGVGGPAGETVSTYLAEKGYLVVGVDMDAQVRFIAGTTHQVVPCQHPRYIGQLIALLVEYEVSLLVPTVSEELTLLSRNRRLFASFGVVLYISSPFASWVCDDKFVTAEYLESSRLPVPKFALSPIPVHPHALMRLCGMPLLAKPRRSRGGRGVRVYDRPERLAEEDRDGLIFQEFVPGVEYDVNLFIDPSPPQPVMANVVFEKEKMENGAWGNAVSVRRVEADDVAMLATRAAKKLGLVGPVDMDIRRRADGTPVILEINARFGANVRSAPEVLEAMIHCWHRDVASPGRIAAGRSVPAWAGEA